MNVFRAKLSQISEEGYLDAWLMKYTVTSAVFNFVRSLKLKQYAKKICLPRYVWSRKRDDVIWHKCYVHRNWKKDFKNLSLGTANRSLKPPWLVATINAKQIVRNLFFQNKVRVDIFSEQTFASTSNTTQIDFHAQGYDCSKAWRVVDWSPVFVFSFRHRQEYRNIRSESVLIARKYLKGPLK